MKTLVAAMRRRGIPPHVLKIAKKWTCPTCEERKRPDPRRFATLETIAKRWEVLEADMGTWMHPVPLRAVCGHWHTVHGGQDCE